MSTEQEKPPLSTVIVREIQDRLHDLDDHGGLSHERVKQQLSRWLVSLTSENGTQVMQHYSTFRDFMDLCVHPQQVSNPEDIRLDGRRSGGNMDVAGTFEHFGKRWKVHADTHYEPLNLAYEAVLRGDEPFVETDTEKGRKLVLVEPLNARRESRYQYIYIYEIPSAT